MRLREKPYLGREKAGKARILCHGGLWRIERTPFSDCDFVEMLLEWRCRQRRFVEVVKLIEGHEPSIGMSEGGQTVPPEGS